MDARHTKGPLAWQRFGLEWCLTGQYGHRPIVLSVGGKPRTLKNLTDGLLVKFDPSHPDSRRIVDCFNACEKIADPKNDLPAIAGHVSGVLGLLPENLTTAREGLTAALILLGEIER
jgi:hypothetical protein